MHTADTPPFIDGGSMIAPRGGFFTRDGKWAVENEGIAPDVDVENWPKDVIARPRSAIGARRPGSAADAEGETGHPDDHGAPAAHLGTTKEITWARDLPN